MRRATPLYRDMEDRLLSRSVVIPEGEQHAGCWMWMGRVEPNGYAKVGVYEGGGKANERVRNYWVHRIAFVTFTGQEIPAKHHVDHRCRFRRCIHPNHLRALPKRVNEHELVRKKRGQQGRYV